MLDLVSQKPAEPQLMELKELRPQVPTPELSGYEAAREKVRSFIHENMLFAVTVLAPIAIALIYYGLLAKDRYEVEARYVIRQPSFGDGPSLGKLFGGGKVTQSTDEAYAVSAYIQSPNAVAALQKKVDLWKIFGRAWTDPLYSYPGILSKGSFEGLTKHYNSLIAVKFDKSSGISSLKVQAFAPQDALAIARGLMSNAEELVNRLTNRSRADALATAEREVTIAKTELQAVQDRITAFRSKEKVIDPTRISKSIVETIAKLSLEIANTNAQLMELRQAAIRSPQLRTLRIRIASLQKQISAERQSLAGSGGTLARIIAEYEQLQLEKNFADKILTAAIASRQSARLDSKRQQLYLEQIVQPKLPDAPAGPNRLLAILLVAIASLITFRSISAARLARSRKSHG